MLWQQQNVLQGRGQDKCVGARAARAEGCEASVWAGRSRLIHVPGNWVPGLPSDLAGRTRVGPTLWKVFESTGDPGPCRKPRLPDPGLRNEQAVTSSVSRLLFSSGTWTTGFQEQETCGLDTQETLRPEKNLNWSWSPKASHQLSMWERIWKWVTFSQLKQCHCGSSHTGRSSGVPGDLVSSPGQIFPPNQTRNDSGAPQTKGEAD